MDPELESSSNYKARFDSLEDNFRRDCMLEIIEAVKEVAS